MVFLMFNVEPEIQKCLKREMTMYKQNVSKQYLSCKGAYSCILYISKQVFNTCERYKGKVNKEHER